MRKVTAKEFELARNVVLWYSGTWGETGIPELSRLTGLSVSRLKSWASAEGLLFNTDSISCSTLPFAWAAFADESRTCQVLHEAYTALKRSAKNGSRFRAWVEECEAEVATRVTAA